MSVSRVGTGFTVVEMIVTISVMSIFMLLSFQVYMTNESQRIAVTRHATANDIAGTNLDKISLKSQVQSFASTTVTGITCDNTTNGSGNKNNLTRNSNATGSVLATSATNGPETTPAWSVSGLAAESITGTGLPADTAQTLRVVYPRGCDSNMPVEIISIVSYGSESVRRAHYVN